MINPFKYGGVVGAESFCNRVQELSDIRRSMENGARLFLYSERRVGKTSLLKLALKQLESRDYLSAYIDLWPTDGCDSLALAMAKSLTENIATTADKMLQMAKDFFTRLVPSITVDDEGKPRISFESRLREFKEPELTEILSVPQKIAEQRNKRVVIVLDEFQRILEYNGDSTERILRSAIQNQDRVSYIFSGSRKHIIQRMLVDQSRPLYGAGGHYPLRMINYEDWKPFIKERFENSHKIINEESIFQICKITGGHPFYTQHLSHVIWEKCSENEPVSENIINASIDTLLERESYAYTSLWETFTPNQRRFMIGLAAESESAKVYSGEFIQKYRISSSSIQRIIESLLERDILDRDNGSYLISDRFFKIWIKKQGLQV